VRAFLKMRLIASYGRAKARNT